MGGMATRVAVTGIIEDGDTNTRKRAGACAFNVGRVQAAFGGVSARWRATLKSSSNQKRSTMMQNDSTTGNGSFLKAEEGTLELGLGLTLECEEASLCEYGSSVMLDP